ncbi:MATE family efflux transporter [uncultured Ruminococcus sp.]|uniref:MATE family efflux transporter n=1 Tax=uncultured Ruminococcus sp. TaxID=165186 RepID=UPI00265CEDDA|nr:MATE family efflux transporter [uncultured Ruminococcus sp.]
MMSSKTKQYEMDMCSGPILRKMLMFALPLMLSSILQLLFNAADIVVVGKFAGDNSLAAVGSNTALINLLTNLFIGLSIGANVVAARHYGAKAWDDLRRTVHTAMLLSMLSGALLLVLGVIGAEQMLIWMQTPEEVLPLATVYLRIYFLGMISTMVYNFGSALLRAVGDTKRPLYFLLCAGIINVILNLLFVIGFQMDVMGVAIATVISETVSALLVLRCLVKEKGGIHLELRAMRIDRKKMLQILRIGLPAGFQGVVFALSNVVIQSSVNIFGNIVVAGNSAAANLEGFVYMAMNAFYQTTLSFVSQNYGAGEQKRINRIVLLGEACVIVTGTLLGNMVVFFGNDLLQIYSNNPEVIAAGMVRLHYISMIYALCGIMDVMAGALRGIGYSIMPMIVSIVGVCVLRLIWLATVFQIPEFHKIETVYLSYPVTWILTSLVYIVFFVWIRIRSVRKKSAPSAA